MASLPALSFAAPGVARLAVQGAASEASDVEVQTQPSDGNELTLTIFVHGNATRLTELGYILHYNGFVYLIEGLQVNLYHIERTVVEEGENSVTTITQTLVGEGTTDANGEVSFTVRPGYYYIKLVHDDQEIRIPHGPILVFSDRSIYVPLGYFVPHRPYGEYRPHADAPRDG
jgi:hypothetical protein